MITILINTYNDKPEHLDATISSVLLNKVDKQIIVSTLPSDKNIHWVKTYEEVEIFLCDETKHPGKSAEGIYFQINSAIEAVKGNWFTMISGNDFMCPDRLNLEKQLCIENEKLVCYSDFFKLSESGNIIHAIKKFFPYNYNRHLHEGNFISDTALIHTSLLKKYFPFRAIEYGNFAHWDFWLRIFEGEGNVFHYNNTPTWFYRQHSNASHRNRTIEEDFRLQLLKEKMLCRGKK